MDVLSVNTDQLKAQGEELKTIASELSNLYDEMYGKLTNIGENGVWRSESRTGSANTFISNVKKDSINNRKLSSNISKIGTAVVSYSNSINSSADTSVGR